MSAPWSSFNFEVSATFSYLTSLAVLEGSYSSSGHFSLRAEFDNFGIREIDAIFFTLFSNSLTLPEFDVHVGSAVLSVVSGDGLSVSLRNVDVAGYDAADVTASFTLSGVSLSGTLSSNTVLTFGDAEIRNAVLQVSFWTSQKQKQVDVMLGGTLAVDFLDFTVTAAVHLYPGSGGIEWAVVAELDSQEHSIALSDVVSVIKKGSFLDLSLKNIVFMAASSDDPLISRSYPGYTVRRGQSLYFRLRSGTDPYLRDPDLCGD
jgi:hypothetical protein